MARNLLHIGELARLVGVTPKTIRHYHKVGLLAEPERTETGYRLYTAHDLMRVQRIRRLQSFGLSLQQVKKVLGEVNQEHTLREVLQSLDQELAKQIQALEERRQQISKLLSKPESDGQMAPQLSSATQFAYEQLGGYLSQISPALWEIELKTNELLDSFVWPEAYQQQIKHMVQYFVEHPTSYERLLALGERIIVLMDEPVDTPLVEQLIEECLQDEQLAGLVQQIAQLVSQIPHLTSPFTDIMSHLLLDTLGPAQQRFIQEIARRTG